MRKKQKDLRELYSLYAQECAIMGLGVPEFKKMNKAIIDYHCTRHIISEDSKRGMYRTNLDNGKDIRCKTLDGLYNKIIEAFYNGNTEHYQFGNVYQRFFARNRYDSIIKPATLTRYQCDYNKFVKDTAFDKIDIRKMTGKDVTLFFDDVLRKYKGDITSKCFANLRHLIKIVISDSRIADSLYLDDTLEDKIISYTPSKLYFRKKTVDTHRVFAEADIKPFVNALTDDDVDLGLLLLFNTGLRSGELCSLRVQDIDFDNRMLNINRAETRYNVEFTVVHEDVLPKEDKQRHVMLNDTALDILHILADRNSDYLFPYYYVKGKTEIMYSHKHKNVFNKRMEKICNDIHIAHYSPHDIRRTFCSQLVSKNYDNLVGVSKLLGHADTDTTERYYLYDQTDNKIMLDIVRSNEIKKESTLPDAFNLG